MCIITQFLIDPDVFALNNACRSNTLISSDEINLLRISENPSVVHFVSHIKYRPDEDHKNVLFSVLTPSLLWQAATYISEECIASIQPEVRGFCYQWCNWNFSLTQSSRPRYGPGIESSSNRNDYQQHFRCVRLTALPLPCADFHVIGEPRPPGTLRACPGLYRYCFTFSCCLYPRIFIFCSTCEMWMWRRENLSVEDWRHSSWR